MDRADFDALLDEQQAREQEDAWEREAEGDREARRPDAERLDVCFNDLCLGDYITAETGPGARWVEVVAVARSKREPELLRVTFKTPQPLGVGLHDRHVIDRRPDEMVTVDAKARGARHWQAAAARRRLSSLAE